MYILIELCMLSEKKSDDRMYIYSFYDYPYIEKKKTKRKKKEYPSTSHQSRKDFQYLHLS